MGAIETVLKRADAEVLVRRKWSDRRLCYDMGKVTRGTYILCYFNADPLRIAGLEKDIRLSETILRSLILRADERPEGFNERDMAEKTVVADRPAEDDAPRRRAPVIEDDEQ
jgi:small subunit ribosomal protein S6